MTNRCHGSHTPKLSVLRGGACIQLAWNQLAWGMTGRHGSEGEIEQPLWKSDNPIELESFSNTSHIYFTSTFVHVAIQFKSSGPGHLSALCGSHQWSALCGVCVIQQHPVILLFIQRNKFGHHIIIFVYCSVGFPAVYSKWRVNRMSFPSL